MFYAEKNNGAFFNNHRMRVSKKTKLTSVYLLQEESLKKEIALPYRKSGCAALDLAYVASGRYDGYFQHNLNLWDIAAGILLVKEAGGITNKIDLSINENIKIIASTLISTTNYLKNLTTFNCFKNFICYKSRHEKKKFTQIIMLSKLK